MDSDLKKYYDDYIESQLEAYETTAKLIGYTIKRMQKEGKISETVSITGRIKNFESAYVNDGVKKIDDCFGLRILASDEDLDKIKEKMEKILIVRETKDHKQRKETKYNAIHQMVYANKEYLKNNDIDSDLFPLIEIQYWDETTNKECTEGDLSYTNYKKVNIEEIAKKYEDDPESVYADLPTIYDINGTRVTRLSKRCTLFKLYPELKNEVEKSLL